MTDCRSTYSPLPTTTEAFFRADLADFFRKEQLAKSDPDDQRKMLFEAELRHLTFKYSSQMSVLYGLQQAQRLADGKSAEQCSKLTLHVVGSRKTECENLTRWELLIAHFPRLTSLTVVFVGPEIRCEQPPAIKKTYLLVRWK